MRYWVIFFSLLAYMSTTKSVNATSNDHLLCARYFAHFEEKYVLPKNILTALGMQESGKWHAKSKKRTSWPWAFNVGGKGYYFNSKEEALLNVRKLKRRNIKSYDVGCMQINMKYHPKAFRNISEAFNPKHNVEYAAKFLRDLYKQKGSWRDAIASYHSGQRGLKTRRGREYTRKIIKIWRGMMQEDAKRRANLYIPIAKRKPLYMAEQLKAYKSYAQTKSNFIPRPIYD